MSDTPDTSSSPSVDYGSFDAAASAQLSDTPVSDTPEAATSESPKGADAAPADGGTVSETTVTSVDGEVAKPETKPEETREPTSAELAALLRLDRQVKAEAKRLSEERRELEAAREAAKAAASGDPDVAAVKKALASRDPLGALKALGVTDADMFEGDNSVYWRLSKLLAEQPDKSEPTAEEIAKRVAEAEYTRLRAAEKEAEAKEREAASTAARNRVVENANFFNRKVVEFGSQHLDDYPAVAQYGINPVQVINPDVFLTRSGQWVDANGNEARPGFVQEFNAAHRRLPTEKEVLDAFEDGYRAYARSQFEALGGKLGFTTTATPSAPQKAAAAAPGVSPSSTLKATTGPQTSSQKQFKTLDEFDEWVMSGGALDGKWQLTG